MGACKEVRTWVQQQVLTPVEKAITEARTVCQEIGQWVEDKITKPVERWVSRVEKFCRDLPWPLSWLCDFVTVWIKIIEWVVETVVKWVVTIVCQVVTFVIGWVVEFVLRIVGWFVTFVVCLFTEPLEALKSIYDLWNIVLDAIGDVVDFVGTILDDVIGLLDDVDRLIDSVAASLGWLGVVLGIVKGIIQIIRQLVEIVRDLVNGAKDLILGILSLDSCRILRGLANLGTAVGRGVLLTGGALVAALLGNPLLAAILLGLRVVGAAVGGVRDSVQLKQVEEVVEKTIRDTFGGDTERIDRSLDKLNLASRIVGLPIMADARRMFLSSRARVPDLRALHQAGTVNLYSLAGYVSDCREAFNQPDAEVVYAGTDTRVSFTDLDAFLADGPDAVAEFHVFPITKARFTDHLEQARKKARYVGVRLDYGSIGSFEVVKNEWMPLNATEDDNTVQQAIFRDFFGRNGTTADDLSTLPALSHLHYVKKGDRELFGLTCWFRPSINDAEPSGVTYRNRSPDWVGRWVLVHEMGHYWGLDHKPGERGLDEIMYTPKDGIAINASTVFEYLLLGGEARFTTDDLRTTWTWVTTDGAPSLLP